MPIIFVFYSISPRNFYTNFDPLFPSVVIDFPFLRLNRYFETAKFVCCVFSILQTLKSQVVSHVCLPISVGKRAMNTRQ